MQYVSSFPDVILSLNDEKFFFITKSKKHSSLLKEHSAISTEIHWKAVISLFTNDSLHQTFPGGLCEDQTGVSKNDRHILSYILENFSTINKFLIDVEMNVYF